MGLVWFCLAEVFAIISGHLRKERRPHRRSRQAASVWSVVFSS